MRKNKKIMKRLFGILISIVMMMGMMATTVFAVDGDGSATITINKGSAETLEGMRVEAYKVLGVTNPDQPQDNWIYQVDSNFDDFFNIDNTKNNNSVEESFDGTGSVYLTYENNHLQANKAQPQSGDSIVLTGDDVKTLDETYGEADLVSRLTGDSNGNGESENALLYTWLEKYIESKGDSLQATVTTGAATALASSIGITGLDEGYYALIFKNVPDKVNVKQGILISTAEVPAEGGGLEPANINLKAENIPFTKEVADSNDPDGEDLEWGENASAAVGDTLSYKLTTNVPNLTDYSNLTAFNISDTLSNQKLDANSITIKIGNNDPATAVYDQDNIVSYTMGGKTIATLSTNAYDSTKKEGSFALTFVPSALESYQGKEIVVTYTAELTADAVKVNDNTAKLEYTNNDDNNTLTAETEVYTYGIQIQKTFSDGSTTANYPDVTFKLYQDGGTKGFTLTGTNGVYTLGPVASSEDAITNLQLKSTDGTLTIFGLDDDVDYILKETKTADKFNTVEDIRISLVAQETPNGMLLDANSEDGTTITIGNEKAPLQFINNTDNSESAIAIAKFTVLNQKGFNLPQTGGAGTWMLTIGGIILIAAAAGLFVASRRKASK